jgi:hypothetical protein
MPEDKKPETPKKEAKEKVTPDALPKVDEEENPNASRNRKREPGA